jgi:hypothetical protein
MELPRFVTERAGGCVRILLAAAAGSLMTLTGCSEPVGHSRTTEKTVVETPTEKTTTTEVHEKETRYVPK